MIRTVASIIGLSIAAGVCAGAGIILAALTMHAVVTIVLWLS